MYIVKNISIQETFANKLLIFMWIKTENDLRFHTFSESLMKKMTTPPHPIFLIKVNYLSPATAPDDKVAIIGVFVLELIWARHLKSNPSSAIA